MKRKVAMAMVAAMAVGSLAVPVMAEDGAAGGKIGISMPTQSLERWNRDGSYLQKQFEDAGYEVELTYSDNETDRQVNDIQNLISDGVNLLVVAAIDGEDIRIQMSEEVEPDFHPRYCDSEKTYEYRILNRKFPVPTERLYSYFYHYKLDVDKMREATSYLIGRHDFASFCGSGAQVKTTIRTVTGIEVFRDGDIVTIRVSGTGFLYNMVRIISGTLIEIGNGQYPPERMQKILDAKDRSAAGPTAPAQGLTLMGIQFFD